MNTFQKRCLNIKTFWRVFRFIGSKLHVLYIIHFFSCYSYRTLMLPCSPRWLSEGIFELLPRWIFMSPPYTEVWPLCRSVPLPQSPAFHNRLKYSLRGGHRNSWILGESVASDTNLHRMVLGQRRASPELINPSTLHCRQQFLTEEFCAASPCCGKNASSSCPHQHCQWSF